MRKGFFGDTSLEFEAKWDHLGNLASRKDGLYGSKAETFAYDEHNRLTSNTLDGTTVSVKYNKIDNITSKSDQSGGATYNYHPTKVHAVVKVGTRVLAYDSNGNATKDGDKTLTYSVKDQATKIVTPNHTSEFNYGVGGSRFKRIDTNSEGKQTATLYLGSVEKVYNADGSIVWKRSVGGKVQILHTQAANGAVGTGKRQYLLHDHLGSVAAITNSVGDITQRMAYDPWGARRKITSNQWQAASMDPLSGLTAFYKANKPDTNRGFTGHEMLDEVGIIHMNGRIYDATLGRFLQADPHIQSPTAVGSLNRYSYVMNNPLNATDPTGYFFDKVFKSLNNALGDFAPFVDIALLAIPGVNAWVLGGWLEAAAFGFATGGISSGSLDGAIVGGVSSAAFVGIGNAFDSTVADSFLQQGGAAHLAAHGLVGGISSVLSGGKFGHGFISASITKSLAPSISGIGGHASFSVTEAAVAGLIGGTISELTGGKFANGASTALLANVFNEQASKLRAAAAQKEDLTGAYSPLPQEHLTADGSFTMMNMEASGAWADSSGNYYNLDSLSGIASPLASGAATSVCPSCYLVGAGGALRAIFGGSKSAFVTVTSWAPAGTTADLAAGRWVMMGGATRWNFMRTGLGGPQATLRSFSWGAGQGAYTPITGQVLRSRVGLPWTQEYGTAMIFKAPFGQRILK